MSTPSAPPSLFSCSYLVGDTSIEGNASTFGSNLAGCDSNPCTEGCVEGDLGVYCANYENVLDFDDVSIVGSRKLVSLQYVLLEECWALALWSVDLSLACFALLPLKASYDIVSVSYDIVSVWSSYPLGRRVSAVQGESFSPRMRWFTLCTPMSRLLCFIWKGTVRKSKARYCGS